MRIRRLAIVFAVLGASLAPALSSSAPPASITFGVAGDLGANSKTEASLAALNTSGVDFFLAIGDLDYKEISSPAAWCGYVKDRLPALGPTFPFQLLAGNHEEKTISQHAACLPDRMGSTLGPSGRYATEYFFDYPSAAPLIRAILISPALTIDGVSYNYDAGTTRHQWVADAIDGARAAGIPWVLVGMHKHCTIASSSSCDIGGELMDMLVSKKVDLVVQGHKHTYQRGKQLALGPGCSTAAGSYNTGCVVDDGTDNYYSKGRGTIPLVNGMFGKGGSSSPGRYYVKAGSGDGFTKMTVTAERIDAVFVNATGSFTDSYSIVPNQPPVVTNPGAQDDVEGAAISKPLAAFDPEGGPLTFNATGLPPGLTVGSSSGVIAGTIAQGARSGSPYSSRVTATDNRGASTTIQFTWVVRDVTPPATPATLTITRHTTGVHLDWPDGTEHDLAGYELYRSAAAGGTYTKLHSGLLAASEYFDSDAPPDATSYYRVTAVDWAGNFSAPRSGSAARSKIVFVAQTAASGRGSTLRVARPAGVQAGDVLVAALSVRGTPAAMPPVGWTLVSHVWQPGTLDHHLALTRTVVTAEPGAYDFSFPLTSSAAAAVVAYRGAVERPSRAAAQSNQASTQITAPPIVPAATGSVQVGFFGIMTAATVRAPDAMMGRSEAAFTGSPGVALAAADVIVDALPVPARVAVASAAALNAGIVVVLSPAP